MQKLVVVHLRQLSAHLEQAPSSTKYPSPHLMHLELDWQVRQFAGRLEHVKHCPFLKYCPLEHTKHLLVPLQLLSILQADLSSDRT